MRPTPRLLLTLALGVPLAALSLLPLNWGDTPIGLLLWWGWMGATALVMLLEALLACPASHIRWTLRAPRALGVGHEVVVRLDVEGGRSLGALELGGLLGASPHLGVAGEARTRLATGTPAHLDWKVRALRRGQARLTSLWLRWTGPLGLLERIVPVVLDHGIDIGPDVRPAQQSLAHLTLQREIAPGQKIERFLGEGSEFESMRDYVHGLDPRSMDWRSTARHRRLICREHRAERNHPVVIALDTGHRMSEPLQDIPRLDHAIRAGLSLAWQALRSGDRAGLFAFGERPGSYAPPRTGMQAFGPMQQLAASLQYGTAETNFTLGLTWLTQRLTRRSLVVLLTDFLDTVSAQLMLEHVARLARHHVLIFVALRDGGLGEIARAAPQSTETLCRSVVATGLEREREQVLTRLRRSGVLVVDARPQDVDARLIDRYLEVKRRELVA